MNIILGMKFNAKVLDTSYKIEIIDKIIVTNCTRYLSKDIDKNSPTFDKLLIINPEYLYSEIKD